jgi:hypothetical protein
VATISLLCQRKQRAEDAKTTILQKYGEQARKVLETLLDKYTMKGRKY